VRATRAEGTPGARLVLALLALATAVALLLAQHLKDKPPLIDGAGVAWHPAQGLIDARTQPITFSFHVGYRDNITVSIVAERTGRTVAVLARERLASPYPRLYFRWTDAASAPAGTYEVEVHFERLDRTTIVPLIRFALRGPR